LSVPFAAAVADRPRGFVSLRGPDAEDYLQRMVSNDVAALGTGESCDALLLTPKARVIALLRVLRRAPEDFLLLTEPWLAETVRAQLLRARFAAKVAIDVERHDSCLVLGDDAEPPTGALFAANVDYGVPGYELIDAEPPAGLPRLSELELEVLRIGAGTPRIGREVDDRVLPAEAGLVERAVSFTKGCYPGQEPIARLHYRGHVNRGLRVLAIEGDELPEYDAGLTLDGKAIGRVTSAAVGPDGDVVALAYVRREVPEDAELRLGDRAVRPLHLPGRRP
jgi:folate-binding protein YgfZ